MIKNIV